MQGKRSAISPALGSILEPIVISDVRGKFLIVKTVVTRREAAARFKLMALNNEDLQPLWLEIGNPILTVEF